MSTLGNSEIVTIVVHYNEPELCASLLIDLVKILPERHKVIVVDNCSSEDSYNFLKLKVEKLMVEIIQNVKNVGFGGGVNFGVNYAKKYHPKYLHVINTDTKIINPNYLSFLINVLSHNPDIALVGPAVKKPNGEIQNTIMPFPSLKSILLFKKNNTANSFVSSPPQINPCEVVNGVCFVVNSNNFYEVEGFDEDYFMYVEEQDLSFKLRAKGKQSAFVSMESITHYGADSFIKDVIDWKYVYNRKNLVLFLHKRNSFLSAFIISLFFSLSLLYKIILKKYRVVYKNPLYILKQFFFPKTN